MAVMQVLKPYDDVLFAATFLSFLSSVYQWFSGQKDAGVYVGLWVPSILAFGGYIKTAMKR